MVLTGITRTGDYKASLFLYPISIPRFNTLLFTITTTSILVILTILVHLELLLTVNRKLVQSSLKPRLKVIICVFSALLAHVLEIWLFALGYWLLTLTHSFGYLTGAFSHGFRDCVYFSIVVYSSVGFGDILPMGNLRFMAAIEALTELGVKY